MPRSGNGPRIVIFAEPRDGHAKSLSQRFTRMGARPQVVRLQDCGFDSSQHSGLLIPGGLPDGALVRTVAEGTFEAVTKRLGVLHALREIGIPVWNDARTVERCVDKSMTSFLFHREGLPTPATWAVESRTQAADIIRRECAGGPLVLKPLFGSQGRGLKLVRQENDLPSTTDVAGVYYLQRFVEVEGTAFHDYRVFVVSGRPIAAMRRASTHWITNVKRGGQPFAALVDPELGELAARAAAAVEAGFCGVDIIRAKDGRNLVLEVNSMPAWAGLQKVTPLNIASEIATAFMARLSQVKPLRSTA